MNKLIISNQKGRILKEYQGGEYVIIDTRVEDNIVTIKRGILNNEKVLHIYFLQKMIIY